MRAIVIEELSGPSAAIVRDVPVPEGAHLRSPGVRVLVEVHAVGLSFIDPLQTRGAYQGGVDAPYVCGSELSGVILEAPANSGFAAGDRVGGIVWQGALAEQALAHPDYLVKLPDEMSFVEGAAVYMNYSTAYFAIERAGAVSGESILIQGAGGGVGTALVDLAAAMELTSFAIVSSDAKATAASTAGAAHVLRADGPWQEEVKQLTDGHGVQVVIDPVGGDRFTDSLRALAIGGRLVVVGFAGGAIPTVKVNRLLLRNLTVTGIAMDVMEKEFPGTAVRVRDAVQGLLDRGAIHPTIGAEFSFEESAAALISLEDRTATGKVVITVR